jgi:hypothetical protein
MLPAASAAGSITANIEAPDTNRFKKPGTADVQAAIL